MQKHGLDHVINLMTTKPLTTSRRNKWLTVKWFTETDILSAATCISLYRKLSVKKSENNYIYSHVLWTIALSSAETFEICTPLVISLC